MIVHSGVVDHLEVDSDSALSGVGTNGAVVRDGSCLVVSGVLQGALVIEPDASVVLTGVANGTLTNQGELELTGIANFDRVQNVGRIRVAVGAVWRNRVLRADGTLAAANGTASVIVDSTRRFELQPDGSFTKP